MLFCVLLFSFPGVYFEGRGRKWSNDGSRCSAQQMHATLGVWQNPVRVTVWGEQKVCGAVMAARESEEDNKWTTEKRFKGETPSMTTCSITTVALSICRRVSCSRWVLGLQMCVLRNLVEFFSHTLDNKLSMPFAYCLLCPDVFLVKKQCTTSSYEFYKCLQSCRVRCSEFDSLLASVNVIS